MDNYYSRPECSNSDLSALKKQVYGGQDLTLPKLTNSGAL